VVSGDFYWVGRVNHLRILAVADSTGHGVPGGFMSMLGSTLLNEIILREKTVEPHHILNHLRSRLLQSLKTGQNEASVQDGMDIALVVVDDKHKKLSYAGAFNPLIIIRGHELTLIKADDMPIGRHYNENQLFTKKEFDLDPNDKVYLFTDGFKDQFGGEHDKKYSFKAFKNLLLESAVYPLIKQQQVIQQSFDDWMQGYEQIDDVLVFGFKVL
jgi:serine phosphatase RsbU (regulator of sigma subunit)